ncbi:MAG: exodeoxyribonuclease V subunit alpha [Propioniciclava sp.]
MNGDVAVSSTGLLRAFSEAGALAWADVQPAQHLTHLFGEADERVALALALTVRALRGGSICLTWDRIRDLGSTDDGVVAVPEDLWPADEPWLEAVRASPAVTVGDQTDGEGPLRLVDGALYLERHFTDQENVRRLLLARMVALSGRPPGAGQDAAIEHAVTDPLTIIAGGPGTGKTYTIRRIVDHIAATEPATIVGLAAPTGKAAARLTESLATPALTAVTLHSLLGWRRGARTRFHHDAQHPLPHDVVIIDEMSMVSMLLMARLLAALKPTARLVLVGDPDQLASVDAGSVLSDMTRAPATSTVVVRLTENHRFDGDIARLAEAIAAGDDASAVETLAESSTVRLIDPSRGTTILRDRLLDPGIRLLRAAAAGDVDGALAALDSHRLLLGHRRGPFGVQTWTRQVIDWLAEAEPTLAGDPDSAVGRPVMVTANAPDFGLYNGDTGVVMGGSGPAQAWFRTGGNLRPFAPFLLDSLTPVHAMTVHKAQGSQFSDVTVVLPPPGSPLLTRELLYTAVTRARRSVVLFGTSEAVAEAVSRPARRMSGLAHRLGHPTPTL